MPSKSAVRFGITAALAGVAMCASILPASATENGIIGQRMTVCPQSLPADALALRDQPLGAAKDQLVYPQTFLVERLDPTGGWVYGFAYGDVNHDYWAQNGYFC